MKRMSFKWAQVFLCLAIVGVLVSALAACSTTPSTTPTPTYTVNVATSPTLGQYLTDGSGRALYWTTADSPGTSNVSGATLNVWPVFYVSSISVPSSLNASNFSSIMRTDGSRQTTYKNWPLYYYVNDTAAGDTKGQGIAGRWSVVNPAATGPVPITTPTPTPTSTPTPTLTPTPTSTAAPTPTPTPTPTETGQSVTVNLVAHNIAFNMSTITVPAGASVTVNFDNQDSGIPHNFAVYTNSSATTEIFRGQIITGPATTTYHFTAPSTPGTYFFRCDVHPTSMTGSFVVTS